MSRARGVLGAALGCALACTGCGSDALSFLALAPGDDIRTVLLAFERGAVIELFAADAMDPTAAARADRMRHGDRVWMLAYAESPGELQLDPGLVKMVPETGPSRLIPPPLRIFRATASGDPMTRWFPETELDPVLGRLRIAPLSGARCVEEGGCFSSSRPGVCNLPCDASPTPTPPLRPVAPAAPSPPVFTPCAPGFVATVDADEVELCVPPPSLSPGTCAGDEAQWLGAEACGRVGEACPAGDWSDALPSGVQLLYVRPGAARGDGSMRAPFGRIAEAMRAALPGTVIALSKGVFDAEVIVDVEDVTLFGACTAETRIVSRALDADTISVVADGLVVQNLRIVAPWCAAAMYAGPARFTDVVVDAGTNCGLFVEGVSLQLRGVVVRSGGAPGIIAVEGARLDADRLVVEGTQRSGVILDGAEGSITSAVIRHHPIGQGQSSNGVEVSSGVLVLSGAAIEGPSRAGVVVREATSTATITEVVIRGVGRGEAIVGAAIALERGAYAHIARVLAEHNAARGLSVHRSVARVEDLLVRDTEEGLGDDVRASLSVSGGSLRGDRILLLRSRSRALALADDATVDLKDVEIRGVEPLGDELQPDGIALWGGVNASLQKVRVIMSRGIATFLVGPGTRLQMSDAELLSVDPDAVALEYHYAVACLELPAFVGLSRTRVAGIWSVVCDGADRVELRDLEIAHDPSVEGPRAPALLLGRTVGLLERAAVFDSGRRGVLFNEAEVQISDLNIERAAHGGLRIVDTTPLRVLRLRIVDSFGPSLEVDQGAKAIVEDLLVSRPRRRSSSNCSDTCDGVGLYAHGTQVFGIDSTIDATRFRLETGEDVGIDVGAFGAVALRQGEVRGFPLGARVRVAPFDEGDLLDRVRFTDVDRFLRIDVP